MKKGQQTKKRKEKDKKLPETSSTGVLNICSNAYCRLRKAGCMGFEGCPGYKARE
ncbi:MAG: hypothetical protein L6290_11390 [Thermodesulfovibrionales bacterium]|nr:hypothetical protein [Thermodesulfovibrionales bacterium]